MQAAGTKLVVGGRQVLRVRSRVSGCIGAERAGRTNDCLLVCMWGKRRAGRVQSTSERVGRD